MAVLKGFLTVKEVAARMGLDRTRITRLIGQGRLKAVRVGRTFLVDAGSVRRFKRRPPGRPRKAKPAAAKAKGRRARA